MRIGWFPAAPCRKEWRQWEEILGRSAGYLGASLEDRQVILEHPWKISKLFVNILIGEFLVGPWVHAATDAKQPIILGLLVGSPRCIFEAMWPEP